MNTGKLLGLLTMTLIVILAACGGEGGSSSSSNVDGKAVFVKYCALCHGEDGKREANGAKDLTLSQMPLKEREALIENGKNLMTPFKGILKPEEIEAVAKYTMSFK